MFLFIINLFIFIAYIILLHIVKSNIVYFYAKTSEFYLLL